MVRDVEVLIVGGGLIGAVLLLTLLEQGVNAELIDDSLQSTNNQVNFPFDTRSLALSNASIRILEQLHIWQNMRLHATSIDTIHISEQGVFGQTRLHNNHPLGYVVELEHLRFTLLNLLKPYQKIHNARCTAYDLNTQHATIANSNGSIETVRPRILVAADGTNSSLRRYLKLAADVKIYPSTALVANIGLARAHDGVAYERFTNAGPLAFLPLTDNRAALVWSLPSKDAAHWKNVADEVFLAQLQKTIGYRLGRFIKVGQRASYPLQQVTMPQCIQGNTVFIGNAAHTLHPVAGQGFNLGLRDVAMLAQILVQKGICNESLQLYQNNRNSDQALLTKSTDQLIKVFANQNPLIKQLRGLGLFLLDNTPLAQSILVRYASGFGGILSDLICQIPLGSV